MGLDYSGYAFYNGLPVGYNVYILFEKSFPMKKIISLLLVLAMALSLFAACGAAPTPTEPATEDVTEGQPELSGTMKVVATSEAYVDLFNKFTEETGVAVEMLSASSGEVLSKLRAEGGTPSADLWFGGGVDAFMSAKDDGLLAQIDQKNAVKVIKPSMEGVELAYSTDILVDVDVALFGSQREDILAKFEVLMGDKAVTE